MPYKLSLLDIALRDELVEAIKDNKVHGKLNSQISTLIKNEKHEFEKKDKHNKSGNKKYVTIDGIKNTKEKIEVDVKLDDNIENTSRGMFIDKKT